MKQFLLLLDGMTGSGKTAISNLLAKDLSRTAIIGMDKLVNFVSDFEKGIRDNAVARDIVIAMTKKYLDLDLSVIVEQPFKTEEIKEYEKIVKNHSIPCYKYQLFTTPDNALQRIVDRQKDKGKEVSKERIKQIKHNISLYEAKDNIGFEVIDTADIKPEEISKKILNNILGNSG